MDHGGERVLRYLLLTGSVLTMRTRIGQPLALVMLALLLAPPAILAQNPCADMTGCRPQMEYTFSDTETFNGVLYTCHHMVVIYQCDYNELSVDSYACVAEGGGGYGYITGQEVDCYPY